MAKNSFFLHCDACHHEVDFIGKMTREHIGYPCPVCQESMLTAQDYKVGRRIQFLFSILRFFSLARNGEPGEAPGPGERNMRVHIHNGKTNIKISE